MTGRGIAPVRQDRLDGRPAVSLLDARFVQQGVVFPLQIVVAHGLILHLVGLYFLCQSRHLPQAAAQRVHKTHNPVPLSDNNVVILRPINCAAVCAFVVKYRVFAAVGTPPALIALPAVGGSDHLEAALGALSSCRSLEKGHLAALGTHHTSH